MRAARSTTRSEKIGYKIREAQLEKVPYMVVVGDKDIENNTISIRKRKEGDLGAMTVEQFLKKLFRIATTRSLTDRIQYNIR